MGCSRSDRPILAPQFEAPAVSVVLEAAGLEYRPPKDPDPAAPPGKTDRTRPDTEASDADRGQKEPSAPASRSATLTATSSLTLSAALPTRSMAASRWPACVASAAASTAAPSRSAPERLIPRNTA